MNKAILLGRIVKNPELKQTQSGASVCNFTIAVDRKYKNRDGERETDFCPRTGEFTETEDMIEYNHAAKRFATYSK